MKFAELSALYHQPLFDLISLFIRSIGGVKKFSGVTRPRTACGELNIAPSL